MTTAEILRPKCGVYLRISDDPGNDELGVQRQEKWALQFCEDYGWHPVIFKDNDTSASKGKPRPQYQAMLQAISAGELVAVAAWGQDRLCRIPSEFETFRNVARANSVLFATHNGVKNLARATDTFHARTEVNMAAYEIDTMRERMKEKFTQLAADGRAWWPSRPFGFTMPRRRTPEEMAEQRKRGERRDEWIAPELVKAEADAIRKAYEDVAAGRSLKEVARQWNSAGLHTPPTGGCDCEPAPAQFPCPTCKRKRRAMPDGKEWDGMAVRALLLNPRNAGLRTYQPDKSQPPEVVGKAAWPQIVSEQTWRGMRATLTDRARLSPGGGFHTGRKHLLSGIATCAACGGTLTSAPAPRTGSSARYACKQAGCLKVKRSMADVDAWVMTHVLDRLADPENVEALTRRRDIDVAELSARLAEIDGERNQAAEMVAAKQLTLSQVAILNAGYDTEVAEIEAQMRDSSKYAVLHRFLGVDDVAAVFDAMTLDEQRAVVQLLVTVAVHPGQAARRPFDTGLVVVEPR
jgi:site-specific DNA recombinase